MSKLRNRWPAFIVVLGILFILVFVIRDAFDAQSDNPVQTDRQQAQATTAALLPKPTSTPSRTPPPTATITLLPVETAAPTATATSIATNTATATFTPTIIAPTTTLIPTRMRTAVPLLPTAAATLSPTPTLSPTEDPQPTDDGGFLTVTPTAVAAVCSPAFCIPRFGASGKLGVISAAHDVGLPFGNYFNWELESAPLPVGEAAFWQMIRVYENGIGSEWDEVALTIDANPRSTWIIGNEPDILWQDNTPAEKYAEIYHDAYQFIKDRDPSALVAVAGVGQPTPLRLAYLDIALNTYQQLYGEPMPVDVWTIHNFILREERDSWGVGIPPGMTQESGLPIDQGTLYEIDDHDDLEIFQQNLIAFRQWMADRGYRDRPLAVTEFGILMPADFGFPPQAVADFMIGTFDFLVQATDETIGYPADENRLVQWSFWYSVYDPQEFPTGNLYDPETDALTALGERYVEYIYGN